MNELFVDIKGYEGFYQISNLGTVKSLEHSIIRSNGVKQTVKERIVKPALVKSGYYTVSLWRNGKQDSRLLHRLIAEHFIPNPDNKPFIDHINTDRTDNTVCLNDDGSVNYEKTNLRWVTPKENNNNPITRNKHKHKYNVTSYGFNNGHSKPVVRLAKGDEKDVVFPNAFSTNTRRVGPCCKGERKTAGGYKWQYVEDWLADWWDENFMFS